MNAFHRTRLVLATAALLAPAVAGAQGAQGGTRAARVQVRTDTISAERRAQLQRELERAVDRARERLYELRDSREFEEAQVRALRQATLALEQADPMTPRFAEAMARVHELAARQQAIFEDAEFKRHWRDAQRLQGELVATRFRRRGYLGVSYASEPRIGPRGEMLVAHDGYPEIVSIEAGSPAARAGLQRGDTIIAYNGRDLRREPLPMSQLLVPGRTVKVKVRRDGRTREYAVKVGERTEYGRILVDPSATIAYAPMAPVSPTSPVPRVSPTPRVAAPAPPAPAALPDVPGGLVGDNIFFFDASGSSTSIVSVLGAQFTQLDDDMRETLGTGRGVLVLKVVRSTQAAQAGLRALDVVTHVNGRPVRSPTEFRQAINKRADSGERACELRFVRQGKEQKATLRW